METVFHFLSITTEERYCVDSFLYYFCFSCKLLVAVETVGKKQTQGGSFDKQLLLYCFFLLESYTAFLLDARLQVAN